MDCSECSPDFLDVSSQKKEIDMEVLYASVVRESVELDEELEPNASDLKVGSCMFHREMMGRSELFSTRNSNFALAYWKEKNKKNRLVSPIPSSNLHAQQCQRRRHPQPLNVYFTIFVASNVINADWFDR